MMETKSRILLVEDEGLINWSLARSLSKWGFEVQRVSRGADALEFVQEIAYDTVLLDYRLPDLDGLVVARHIRTKQPSVRILLLTATPLGELEIEEGLLDACFQKPVTLEELRQMLGDENDEKRPPARPNRG